jgi:hypothetical protein
LKQSITSCFIDRALPGPAGLLTAAFLVAAAAIVALCPLSARAQGGALLTDFGLSQSAFSPDGDGSEESTEVTLTLSEDSPLLTLILYRADSTTVVDTLLAPGARAAGSHSAVWNGVDWAGQAVPEGLYLVRLTAQGTTTPDTTVTLPVAVDLTAPAIQILLSEPGIYTPGLPGTPQVYTLTFDVTNSSNSYGLPSLEDQLDIVMHSPAGTKVTLDTFVLVRPEYQGQDGMYELTWDANVTPQVTDGRYRFDLELTDQAGHNAAASNRPNVDVEPPDVGFLNIEGGSFLPFVPDSLHGWAWDRNGIDSLFVRYADTRRYWYIADSHIARDTTFFSVPLADSLADEGTFRVSIRAKDASAADTGWVATPVLRFDVDRSAPPPPTLNPFNGTWRNPVFEIGGGWSGGTEIIRIYRNGVLVDSVFTVALEAQEIFSFTRNVTLLEGNNVITATAVDKATNESGPSNEVRVQFVSSSGLFIPAPFAPGDQFHLNLSEAASRATLRIYDMAGEVVVILTNEFASRNYAFEWDGLNGDGQAVKKGPLVAVSQAEYDGGGTDVIFREIFLFDPDK